MRSETWRARLRIRVALCFAVPALAAVLESAPSVDALQQAPAPQFRAGIDIVPMDFFAFGPDGRPVTDLDLKEISLRVDGRPRDIRSFQFVRLAVTGGAAGAPAPPALPAPFAANDGASAGRNVVLVFDHEQTRAADGKLALDAAGVFLDRLGPADRVAVVTLPNGRVEIDLTTNHARARAALAKVVGRAARTTSISNISLNEALTVVAEKIDPDKKFTNELIDRECRFAPEDSFCRTRVVQDAMQMARQAELATRATLTALRDFLYGLGGVEAPTTLVFLSGALVTFPDTHQDLDDVARAAARARIQMFVVQAHEPMLDATTRDQPPTMTLDADHRVRGLQDLAGVTGGEFLRLAGTGNLVFAKIADRTASYYLIGFEPRTGEQDGKPHRIQITTTRRNVEIRARPAFVVDDPKRAPPTPLVLENLLREPTMRRDLPLRAVAFTFRDLDPRHVKVVVAVEPGDDATALTSAAFALIDVQGRSAAQWTEEGANVVMRPLLTGAAVPPGDYRLRVAAADVAGRRGTVDYEFRAALEDAAPLTFGALMAGALERGSFRPRLLLEAGAAVVTGYLEFYGSLPSGAVLSAKFEVAAIPGGPSLASAPGSVLGSPEVTRFVATAGVPLAGIPPGDHLLRAIVSVDDRPIGTVVRTFRRRP